MGVITLTVGHLTIFSVMFISIVVGHRDRLRHLLPLPLRGGDLPRPQPQRGPRAHRGAQPAPGCSLGALTAAGDVLRPHAHRLPGHPGAGLHRGHLDPPRLGRHDDALPRAARARGPAPRRPARARQRPRAHQLERIRVPAARPPHRAIPRTVLARAPALVTAASALGAAPRGLRLQPAQPPGQGHGVGGLGASHPRHHGPLRLQRPRLRATRSRSCARKQTAFERLPSVSEVDSVLRVIPDGQSEKIAIIKSFAPLVAPVRIGRSSPVDLDRLTQAAARPQAPLRPRRDRGAAKPCPRRSSSCATAPRRLARAARADRPRRRPSPPLTHLQAQLYRDFVDKFHGSSATCTRAREPRRRPRGAPAQVHRRERPVPASSSIPRWTSGSGRARSSSCGSSARSTRTSRARPIITYEAIRLMERAYLQGTLYAFVLVAGAHLLDAPAGAGERCSPCSRWDSGLLWTVGLMRLFGLSSTWPTSGACPSSSAPSAEFGLNVVMRYLEGREHGGPLVARSTVMAVALNGVTTIVGFGSLMIAHHQGIFGLGSSSPSARPARLDRLARRAAGGAAPAPPPRRPGRGRPWSAPPRPDRGAVPSEGGGRGGDRVEVGARVRAEAPEVELGVVLDPAHGRSSRALR